jgi:predicted acyltransferase
MFSIFMHVGHITFEFCLTSNYKHSIAAIPLNKQLYTFSYICVTAGAAGVVFSIFYYLVSGN